MSTRVRNQGVLHTPGQGVSSWTSVQHFNSGANATQMDTDPNNQSTDDTRESMTDVIGSPGLVHNVTHTKRRLQAALFTAEATFADPRLPPVGGGSRTAKMVVGSGPYMQTKAGHLSVPNGQAIAISRVPTMVPEQVSLLNSLFELKDLRHAFGRVAEHLAWARFRALKPNGNTLEVELFNGFMRGLKANLGSPVSAIRFLTGVDLAWKFGWKPLLADIQTVHSVLGRIEDTYRRISEQEFTCIGTHTETKQESETRYNAYVRPEFPVFARTQIVTRTTKVTWYAGVKRKLSLHAIQFPDAAKRALVREQLGLNVTAARAWEAVPWSFVVDWVLPINNFLEQFNGSPVDPGLVVSGQKWLTTKSVTKIRVAETIVPKPPTYSTLAAGATTYGLSEGEISSYVRTTPGVWTLPPLYVPELKLPNLGQSWTGLELLVQRFRSVAR